VEDSSQGKGQIKADLLKRERGAVSNRAVLIGELLDDYISDLTRKAVARREYGTGYPYKAAWAINKYLRPAFGKPKASALSTKQLNEYQERRIAAYRKSGKGEGSWIIALNREFAYLRRAFMIAMQSTPPKVASHPKFPIDAKSERLRARKGTVNSEQFQLLMEHTPDHLKPILPLVCYSGVRAKELRFIRREQVDWEKRLIRLRDGATKEGPGAAGVGSGRLLPVAITPDYLPLT
jgi:integrase